MSKEKEATEAKNISDNIKTAVVKYFEKYLITVSTSSSVNINPRVPFSKALTYKKSYKFSKDLSTNEETVLISFTTH